MTLLKMRTALVILAALALLAGCSFPRIIIFKDPLTPEEHIKLGAAYEQKKEYDLAIKEYEAAAKKSKPAKLYLANARFLNNQPDQAEKLYRDVLKDDAQCADAYNNLAWLLYSQKKNLPEARDLALKAINLKPQEKEYQDTLDKIEAEMKTSGK